MCLLWNCGWVMGYCPSALTVGTTYQRESWIKKKVLVPFLPPPSLFKELESKACTDTVKLPETLEK